MIDYDPAHNNPNDTFCELLYHSGQLNDGHISPREFREAAHKWLALAPYDDLELLAAALGQWAAEEKRLIAETEASQ
jgi:hypothetical protein